MPFPHLSPPAPRIAAACWRRCRVVAVLATLTLLACGRQPPASFSLLPVSGNAIAPAGFRFPGSPRVENAVVGVERRRVVVTGAEAWLWRGRPAAGARLALGFGLVAPAAGKLEVEIERIAGGHALPLARARARDSWVDLDLDLSSYAGEELELRFTPRIEGEAGADARVAWGPVVIAGPDAPDSTRPNVLMIVVDTLRPDHLTPYGYGRATSPQVQSLLADRGVVVDGAYAQAPWTLPSAFSYFTSRYPGEFLGEQSSAFGIPAGVQTMAEWMAEQGYRTAGFVANPTLHETNGFGRGFSTFSTPPAVVESMYLHGESVNRRALPWLRAHQREPFFLYVHYLDPHDPYDNPETVGGLSPFYPEYRGGISGLWVHGVYSGAIPLPNPAEDVRHLTALYDSEIHYVDARIGELLSAIPAEVLANTLVIFTADHGEELYDHGGWKHGQSLYEEQIRVPLLVRWDGRLAPGTRLAGPVRLLDILPTIAAAAGGSPQPEWQGVNLLPALAGASPLPRLPVFAQHLSSGPLRAASLIDGKKAILFNRRAPFVPEDPLQAHLWRVDLERFERAELYDLQADPGERANRAGEEPEAVRARAALAYRQLDRQLPGVRLMASGLPPGTRVNGTIRFDRPLERWRPYFLDQRDQATWIGGRSASGALAFSFGADSFEKGLLLEGEFSAITDFQAEWADGPGPTLSLLVGPNLTHSGGALQRSRLEAGETPLVPEGPALRLWLRSGRGAVAADAAENAETRARLRALGYIH